MSTEEHGASDSLRDVTSFEVDANHITSSVEAFRPSPFASSGSNAPTASSNSVSVAVMTVRYPFGSSGHDAASDCLMEALPASVRLGDIVLMNLKTGPQNGNQFDKGHLINTRGF